MKLSLAVPVAAVVSVLGLASCTSAARDDEERPVNPSATLHAEDSRVNSSATPLAEDPKVNPTARLLLDFKERLDKYVSIRKSADDDAPPLKKTEDPAEIRMAQDALAQRIRALNANAKHGDVFTPEISALFRRLLRPVVDKNAKVAILEDNPGNFPYKVNAVYPDKEPLSTVPPDVLKSLPPLPKDIEYRFVGKDLILRDARANLIIEYIPNALP